MKALLCYDERDEQEYYQSEEWLHSLRPVTRALIDIGILSNDLEPLRCVNCLSNTFCEGGGEYEDVYDMGHAMKVGYDWKCTECGYLMGHISYGNWEELKNVVPILTIEELKAIK